MRGLDRTGAIAGAAAIAGAVLLLVLPSDAFEAIVPVFIVLALVAIVFQPRLQQLLAKRPALGEHGGVGTWLWVLLAGVYGGYFGAAQGVLLIGVLGAVLTESLQRVNAAKNLLSLVVNLVAAVTFIVVRPEVID